MLATTVEAILVVCSSTTNSRSLTSRVRGPEDGEGFVQGKCGWQWKLEQHGEKEGRKEERKEGFVQDRCRWPREPEQHERRREERKERDGFFFTAEL